MYNIHLSWKKPRRLVRPWCRTVNCATGTAALGSPLPSPGGCLTLSCSPLWWPSLVFGASIPCPSRACKHLFARRVEPLSCWRMGGVGALPAALVQGAGPGPRPNLQLQWIFSLLPCWVDWMGYNWLWESPSIVFISLTGSMCFGEHSRECFCFSLVVVVVLNVCPLAWKKVCL